MRNLTGILNNSSNISEKYVTFVAELFEMMTKEELLLKLTDIEWDDFEVKAAQDKLPENVWETVSAFSNTSGGWIVFGVV